MILHLVYKLVDESKIVKLTYFLRLKWDRKVQEISLVTAHSKVDNNLIRCEVHDSTKLNNYRE